MKKSERGLAKSSERKLKFSGFFPCAGVRVHELLDERDFVRRKLRREGYLIVSFIDDKRTIKWKIENMVDRIRGYFDASFGRRPSTQ